MFDSGFPDRVETTLLAGMKALGLDPARLKYVLIAHEHQNHYGGATHLQGLYPGLRIGMSELARRLFTPGAPPRREPMTAPSPKRDFVIKGKPILLGEARVTPVAISCHTQAGWDLSFL